MSTQTPPTTQSDINIVPTDITDLPVLAEINTIAYAQDNLFRFNFIQRPNQNNALQFYTLRLNGRLNHSTSHVLKAIDTSTGEVIGFACYTFEDGKSSEAPKIDPSDSAAKQMAGFLNQEFAIAVGSQMKEMQDKVKPEKHLYISTIAVLPNYQGKSIGSRLLHSCLDIADKYGLPSRLLALPDSHTLYLRYGFEDEDYVDVDINKWDKYRYRGYGVHRSYSMRRPSLDTAGLSR